jgi:Na+-driven multidrug efflux pump
MSLFKRLMINSIAIYCARLFEGILQLAILAFILSRVSREIYGAALMILSIQAIVYIAREALSKGTLKYIAEYNANSDFESVKKIFATSFIVQLSIGLSGLVICFVIIPYTATIFALPQSMNAEARWATILLGFGIATTFALSPWQATVFAYERYDLVSLARVCGRVARAIFIVFLLIVFTHSLFCLVLATILGNIIELLVCIPIVKRLSPCLKLNLKKISRHFGKAILKFSGLSMLHTLSALLFGQGSLYIAAHLISLDAVAGLGIIRNIAGLIGMVINQVSHILVPISSRLEALGDREKILKLVIHGTTITVFAGGAVMAGLVPCKFILYSVDCIHSTLAGINRVAVDGISDLVCTTSGLAISIAFVHYTSLELMGLAIGLFCARFFRFFFITVFGNMVLQINLRSFIWTGYFRTYLLTSFVVGIAIIVYPFAKDWPTLLFEIAGSATVFVIVGAFFIIDSEDLTRFKSFFYESIHFIRNRTA